MKVKFLPRCEAYSSVGEEVLWRCNLYFELYLHGKYCLFSILV